MIDTESRVCLPWIFGMCMLGAFPLQSQAQFVDQRTSGDGLTLRQVTPEFSFIGRPNPFEFEIRNDSQSVRRDMSLVIRYSNGQPESIPAGCEFRNYNVHCGIGDLLPGSAARFGMNVIPIDDGDGIELAIGSSAAGLDVQRWSRVVHDTLKDSDGDGVSDYIEGLAGTNPNNRASVDLSPSTIDVLAVYTTTAKRRYGGKGGIELRIRQMFDFGNDVLAQSGSRVRLRVIGKTHLEYEERPDVPYMFGVISGDSWVKARRAETGADLVAIIGSTQSGFCGLADIGGEGWRGDLSRSLARDEAFTYSAAGCAIHLLIHEIGHNLGLGHSHRDTLKGAFDFSHGHGVQGSFATIMAEEAKFGVTEKVPFFSHPDLLCNGRPCGVSPGRAGEAHAVKTIDVTGPQISRWFTPPWPEGLAASAGVGPEGTVTESSMSVGILAESGEYNNTVRAGDTIDIVAEIRSDASDLYKYASLHVLVEDEAGNKLQLHGNGAISVWDGEQYSLAPFKYVSQLHAVERFAVVEDLTLGGEFAGTSFDISLAYRVDDKVVWMSIPTTLSIAD